VTELSRLQYGENPKQTTATTVGVTALNLKETSLFLNTSEECYRLGKLVRLYAASAGLYRYEVAEYELD
jgi:hypothetical protein